MKYGQEYCFLEQAVKDVSGQDVQIDEMKRMQGGDINDAYRLCLSDGTKLFLKMNAKNRKDFFTAEAGELEALNSLQAVCVPRVLALGTDESRDKAFLLMEYIESQRPRKAYWEGFGHQLAMLHRSECRQFAADGDKAGVYGFKNDNFIGATPQKNRPSQSWIRFYRDCRLAPQLDRARHYFSPAIRKNADWLLEHLDRYLREPQFPSLLHGDLWSGNMMCGTENRPWIIDPAVYVGDFETDLAMTQLFGSLPQIFYDAYEEVNPVVWKEYEERRDLYHLYHLLNHLNLFGYMYLGSVEQIIRRYGEFL